MADPHPFERLATCIQCGESFARASDQTWKRRCLPRWRQSKARIDSQRVIALERENKVLKERAWKLNRKTIELTRELASLRRNAATLDVDKVRPLLQLCHPDRYGGSALATRVSQWLLDQKRRLEEAQ